MKSFMNYNNGKGLNSLKRNIDKNEICFDETVFYKKY